MGSILSLSFVCRRVCGFSVWTFLEFVSAWLLLHVYVLVDVPHFVILLFQSGALEYMLFCVRVVVATRVCFG